MISPILKSTRLEGLIPGWEEEDGLRFRRVKGCLSHDPDTPIPPTPILSSSLIDNINNSNNNNNNNNNDTIAEMEINFSTC